jgi:dephospho-CoA kinase
MKKDKNEIAIKIMENNKKIAYLEKKIERDLKKLNEAKRKEPRI